MGRVGEGIIELEYMSCMRSSMRDVETLLIADCIKDCK